MVVAETANKSNRPNHIDIRCHFKYTVCSLFHIVFTEQFNQFHKVLFLCKLYGFCHFHILIPFHRAVARPALSNLLVLPSGMAAAPHCTS